MTQVKMTEWDAWIGRSETSHDVVSDALIMRFRATFDSAETGPIAPQGLHWCLCVPDTPTTDLDDDGHPKRGGFFPPIPLPRRMWASSKVQFHAPIVAGMAVTRHSTISNITEKMGNSGHLIFVTIDHSWSAAGAYLVTEQQSLVYRGATTSRIQRSLNSDVTLDPACWHRSLIPSEAMLFRFSAITFNTHRIHYDHPYAQQVEGYPALVVHGPLMASLLLDHAAREIGSNRLKSFEFRGLAPAFAGDPLHLSGQQNDDKLALQVIGNDGRTVMEAQAIITDG
jgi:3-methylfumaryl-CoA hydratase